MEQTNNRGVGSHEDEAYKKKHVDFMENPSRWCWYPYLPLTLAGDFSLATTTIDLLSESVGVLFFRSGELRLLRGQNILLIATANLQDAPVVTAEMVFDEGWRVD